MTTFAQACENIRKDKTASYWLKSQINFLNERDPVDALKDCSVLKSLQQLRCRELGLIDADSQLSERRFQVVDEKGTAINLSGKDLLEDEGLSNDERLSIVYLDINQHTNIGGGAQPLLNVLRLA